MFSLRNDHIEAVRVISQLHSEGEARGLVSAKEQRSLGRFGDA